MSDEHTFRISLKLNVFRHNKLCKALLDRQGMHTNMLAVFSVL